MIYLLNAIGLSPGGSSTVHIYTQTIHRTTQNKQYIEQHNNFGRVRAVPRLGELYPGICLTTEEKARFVKRPVFTSRSCQHLAQTPSWRTTPCRLYVTAYSIYLQLPSMLEAVPPSAKRWRAMAWWQGLAIFITVTWMELHPNTQWGSVVWSRSFSFERS